MNKTFEIEFREDHISVLLSPDYRVTPENTNEFWAAIEEACATYDSRRVLLEGYIPRRDEIQASASMRRPCLGCGSHCASKISNPTN